MTNIKKGIKTLIFLILAFLIIVLIPLIVITNVFDVKFPIFNPPQEKQYTKISLIYPPQTSKSVTHMNISCKTAPSDLPYLSVDILLAFDGSIFERDPIDVTASGFVYPPNGITEVSSLIEDTSNMPYPTIAHNIMVGFEGANAFDDLDPFSNTKGELLVKLDEDKYALEVYSQKKVDLIEKAKSIPKKLSAKTSILRQTDTWENQGDYYPYITVYFKNDTSTRYYYTDYKIHVNGIETKKQENYSRINQWLTIVLLFFTWVAGIQLLRQFMPEAISKRLGLKDDSKNSGNNNPTSTKQDSETEHHQSKHIETNGKDKRR